MKMSNTEKNEAAIKRKQLIRKNNIVVISVNNKLKVGVVLNIKNERFYVNVFPSNKKSVFTKESLKKLDMSNSEDKKFARGYGFRQ